MTKLTQWILSGELYVTCYSTSLYTKHLSVSLGILVESFIGIIIIRYHSRQCKAHIVSCPAHACLPARNSLVNKVNFWGLIPQSSNNQ